MAPPGNHPYLLLIFLSAQTEFFDNSPVSLDVDSLEVVQELTPLSDEAKEGAARDHVLLVRLHMLGEVSDTVGE